MQKNWYIIYTKARTKIKLGKGFAKRKIEYFVPINCATVSKAGRARIEKKPLFPNYIFAKLAETEMPDVTSMSSVINFVHWKQHPVLVANEDIILLKEFTASYRDITVEKMLVNENRIGKFIEESERSFKTNLLIFKRTFVKVTLPSIGLCIIARVDQQNSLLTEITIPGRTCICNRKNSKLTFNIDF